MGRHNLCFQVIFTKFAWAFNEFPFFDLNRLTLCAEFTFKETKLSSVEESCFETKSNNLYFFVVSFFCNFLGCICFFSKTKKYFLFFDNKLFITFNQIYKTNSKIKHQKHKTIYKLYTRLYLVIYFSLTYKFARYHRWNRQKWSSRGAL